VPLSYSTSPTSKRATYRDFTTPTPGGTAATCLYPCSSLKTAYSRTPHIFRTLDAADGRGLLYPPDLQDRVLTWEERFDGELGVQGRRWIYLQTLDAPADFIQAAGYGTPAWERTIGRVFFLLLLMFGRRRLQLNDGAMQSGWLELERLLCDV
jgi:hypothetical protein